MNILDILDKKEKREKLTKEELKFVIDGFLNGTIKDYQMSAFLTEIDLLGLSEEETIDLTDIMLHSGETIDLQIDGIVDKHSTGGVGDKTTIVLAPLVASLGVKVAKMSGRGLGHTGGTIDKLESIEGFHTEMTLEEFKNQVEEIGVALVGQMNNLVPADKKIYALRDVTGTVDSIPLIASSIMSKKLASGASKIVLDLKVGCGALIDNLKEAKQLGSLMVKIGNMSGKETVCVLTNMDEPLGFAIGNSLEVLESIQTLQGKGPKDLTQLVTKLGAIMVSLNSKISIEDASKKIQESLNNGKAYEKFLTWVKAQGGNVEKIQTSKYKEEIKSKEDGYISHINALELGKLARKIGAGRLTKEDIINPKVGFVLNKKVGDKVSKGQTLITMHYDDLKVEEKEILDCFKISKTKAKENKLILDIIK